MKKEMKEDDEICREANTGNAYAAPGTSRNKRGQHRIAQGSSVHIEQCKKQGEHFLKSIVTPIFLESSDNT